MDHSSDRPNVYVDDTTGVVYYRASALGGCLTGLVAARRGLRAKATPEIAQQWFHEGHIHEPDVIERLEKDWGRVVRDSQRFVVMWVIPNRIAVAGHIDGISETQSTTRLLEIKTGSESVSKAWKRSRWGYSYRYAVQFSVYWYALKDMGERLDGGTYVMKNRNNGALDIWDCLTDDQLPVTRDEIKRRVMLVEWHAGRVDSHGFPFPCDRPDFPCPYFYIHPPETKGDLLVTDTTGAVDIGTEAVLGKLAEKYAEVTGKREYFDAIAKDLREKIIGYMGDKEVATVNGFVIEKKDVTTKRVDTKVLRAKYPDIAEECSKPSESTRVSVNQIDGAS